MITAAGTHNATAVRRAVPQAPGRPSSCARFGNARWRQLSDTPGRVLPWTRAEDNDLAVALEAGLTEKQIAADLGRPVDQVIRRVLYLASSPPSPLRRGGRGGEAS